jgi:hypothetical protein
MINQSKDMTLIQNVTFHTPNKIYQSIKNSFFVILISFLILGIIYLICFHIY